MPKLPGQSAAPQSASKELEPLQEFPPTQVLVKRKTPPPHVTEHPLVWFHPLHAIRRKFMNLLLVRTMLIGS